ncbi:unnamed protein product [marine sediment metagenome]|uniref:Uncharacterized protein n=1 Tax=marine sediment metagenome TaxID=412755 RepID=X0ZVZ7_9ZZZZ
MIGPKTREFAEIDIATMAAELIYKPLKDGLTPQIVYSYPATLAMVARLLVKDNTVVHPSFLFGNWWFLHYQAWLWKLSKRWREHTLEYWVKDLDIRDVNLALLPLGRLDIK